MRCRNTRSSAAGRSPPRSNKPRSAKRTIAPGESGLCAWRDPERSTSDWTEPQFHHSCSRSNVWPSHQQLVSLFLPVSSVNPLSSFDHFAFSASLYERNILSRITIVCTAPSPRSSGTSAGTKRRPTSMSNWRKCATASRSSKSIVERLTAFFRIVIIHRLTRKLSANRRLSKTLPFASFAQIWRKGKNTVKFHFRTMDNEVIL